MKKTIINKIEHYRELIRALITYMEDLIKFHIHKVLKWKHFKDLRQFKDKYKNQRCFILGTGPSLAIDDIEKLKNEKTFAVNSFIKALGEISYRPTFYGFIDGVCMELYGEEILSSGIHNIFFTKRDDLKKENYHKLNKSGAYELPQMNTREWVYYAPKMPRAFSKDISKETYWGYTVVYTMMQVAAYMGFTEMYLLGMDCCYMPGVECFKDMRSPDEIKSGLFLGKNDEVEKYIIAHKAVKKYADSQGIKIYNATRGGALEVFPRVDLDDIL